MTRILFVTVLVVLALFSAMGMGVAGVQAQDNENETDDLESNATAGLEHQEAVEFTDQTRILGWEIRNGQVTIVFESETRSQANIADALAGVGEDEAVAVPETTHQLERHDTTTVRMDLTEFQGGASAGVTVDGQTVRLSSEMDHDDNPLRYFGGEQGLMYGMFMSVAMSGGAAGFVLWREENGVMKA